MTQIPARILMLSIVDPAVRRGGAWTVTRGLLELFRRSFPDTTISTLAPPEPLWRGLRQAACVASAPLTGVPAKVLYVRHRGFREQVKCELTQGQFDLLVINGSDLL